jgi:hypothetical protein
LTVGPPRVHDLAPLPADNGERAAKAAESDMTWALHVQGARLVVREGDGAPIQVPLERKPITLGRATDNDIVVRSEFVAAYHARIEPVGQDFRIVDLGGACGILFGGQHVGTHNLRHGDVIRIGDPLTGSFVTLAYQRRAH